MGITVRNQVPQLLRPAAETELIWKVVDMKECFTKRVRTLSKEHFCKW